MAASVQKRALMRRQAGDDKDSSMDTYSGCSKLGNFVCMTLAADFVLFVVSYLWFGGAAFGAGRILGGHYFLSDHGKLTETTKAIYLISEIHGMSLFFLAPFAICFSIAAAVRRHKGELAAGCRR